jgi:hypothetical protein
VSEIYWHVNNGRLVRCVRERSQASWCLPLVLAALVVGCTGPSAPAPGGHLDVVPVRAGSSGATIGEVPVGTVFQVVVAFPGNNSKAPVRIRAVRLADQPPGVCVRQTAAYRARGIPTPPGSGQAIMGSGAWNPEYYGRPRPVSAITLAPDSGTSWWIAVIVFTVTRPGRYYFTRAKVIYDVGSIQGWQYENLGLVIDYSRPLAHGEPLRPAHARC